MMLPRLALPLRSPHLLLALLLGLTLVPSSLAEPPAPFTGEARTQVIDLAEGWNFVSLSVLPEEAALDSLLASILPEVVLVKDEAGRHFSPAYGIRDIASWRWDKAYMVRVRRATQLSVTGPSIEASGSSIELGEGWSWVPYLGIQPLPVEEAFASILASVQQIRDGAGRTYEPGEEGSTLATVEPGQGYTVSLAEEGLLVFPPAASGDGSDEDGEGESDGGGAADFPNLAAALAAITADDLGRSIILGGYHADGDGGGGTFEVIEDGSLLPNRGTIFAPEAALGEVIVEERTPPTGSTTALSWGGIAPGTLSLTLSGPDAGGNPWSITIPDDYMHGASGQRANSWRPAINYVTGRFLVPKEGGTPTKRYLSAHIGSDWQSQVTATYTYRRLESPLRLVRTTTENGNIPLSETTVWSPLWFGCRPHKDAPYFDNTNCLNWTLLAAKQANEALPGTVTEVRLPDLDGGGELYYYFKSIIVPDGVTLSGAAGAELVEETDEFGNTYSPVRPREDAVVLKVLPEEADGCEHCAGVLSHILMRRPYSDAAHLPPAAYALMGNTWTQIQPDHGALSWGVRNLVLDGNEAGQQAIYSAPYVNQDRETGLRNTPSYSGIAQSKHGGKLTDGQRLTVDSTYITGYSATGLITDSHADTTKLRVVGVGDAYYNHGSYLIGPIDAENLSVHGKGWGHVEFYGGLVKNLVLERLSSGRNAIAVFNFRGGDYDTCQDMQDSESDKPCGTIIDGFYADLRESERTTPFAGIGPEIEIRNGIIITEKSPEIFRENSNGYQTSRNEGFRMENVDIHIAGGGGKDGLVRSVNLHQSLFRNIRLVRPDANPRSNTYLIGFGADSRRGDASKAPFEVVYDGFGSAERPFVTQQLGVAGRFYGPEDTPHRFFLMNSHHQLETSTILRDPQGHGLVSSICETSDPCEKLNRVQVYFRDVEVEFANIEWGGENAYCMYGNCELFFELGRFENLVDPARGLASETTKTFTCSGGEASGHIESGLLWTPHATRGEVSLSGPLASNVTSQEFQTTSGGALTGRNRDNPRFAFTLSEPCQAGQTLTVDFKLARWLDENGEPVSVPDWYQQPTP